MGANDRDPVRFESGIRAGDQPFSVDAAGRSFRLANDRCYRILGIGLGIHWIVYSWIVQHPVGLTHAILRTVLVVTAWSAFPERRMLAVPAVIVVVYLFSLVWMSRRPVPAAVERRELAGVAG